MSRIGKLPIEVPNGVTVEIEGQSVKVNGPKGSLERKLPRHLILERKETYLLMNMKRESTESKVLQGTNRALVSNMVQGVTQGWSKQLSLVGTGYRAEVSGDTLVLNVGFSQPVKIVAPEAISFKVEKLDITVEGPDKELVGQIAAKIRSVRPPEPYKGKGIRYKGEEVRRKAGKAAKAVGGAA